MLQTERSTYRASVLRLGGICLVVLAPAVHSENIVSQDLRIENVTIVSPESAREIDGATVTIHDGRIQSISSRATAAAGGPIAARRLDGTNLYLIPGLIDSHVHLGGLPGMTDEQERAHPDIARAAREQIPRSYLYSGFTTLIDLISTPEGMARWNSHDSVPDTYFCGGAVLMDGYPSNYLPKESRYTAMPYWFVEAQTPDPTLPRGVAASEHTPPAVVTRMKAEGAICVKIFFERGFGGVHNLPVPKAETIRALVRAAHAAGLPVFMHANSLEAQQFALETGVDIIAHGLWNTDEKTKPGELTALEKSVLDRVIAADVGWQPTLRVLYGLRGLFDNATLADPRLNEVLPRSLIDWYRSPQGGWFRDSIIAESPELASRSVAANMLSSPINRVAAATGYMAQHHARLLFGTDTPSSPTYANPPGLNGWMEMRHLADAGMTPEQIFQAATLSNAHALKLDSDVGTVQVGKRANLLLVRADPRKTIEAYQEIAKVILGGRVLDPSILAANGPER